VALTGSCTGVSLKHAVCAAFDIDVHKQHLYYCGSEIPNHAFLYDIGMMNSGSVVDLHARTSKLYPPDAHVLAPAKGSNSGETASGDAAAASSKPQSIYIRRYPGFGVWNRTLLTALDQAILGLQAGTLPKSAGDGTSGTYFLRSARGASVGCFKPRDEEPHAPNNPNKMYGQLGQEGLKPGVCSGEAWKREVAAYLLDRGFAGVPPTAAIESKHPSYYNGEPTEPAEAEPGAAHLSLLSDDPDLHDVDATDEDEDRDGNLHARTVENKAHEDEDGFESGLAGEFLQREGGGRPHRKLGSFQLFVPS